MIPNPIPWLRLHHFALAFATATAVATTPAPTTCDLELADGRVRPVVNLPFRAEDVFAVDDIGAEIHWPPLLGREIKVEQRGNKVLYRSTQKFLGREALLVEFPTLAHALATLDENHAAERREYECSWILRGARALGLFPKTVKACDAYWPGEIGILIADGAGEHWESEPALGSRQFRSLAPRLMMFDGTALIDALKSKLLDTFDQNSPPPGRPRVDVILVHNHPGPRPTPLSRQDLKVQRKMAEILHAWDGHFDFTMTMIALGTLDSPRDVAFLRTLDRTDVAEETTKPKRRGRTRDGRATY